jgi:nuclear transcription factor Y, gamma
VTHCSSVFIAEITARAFLIADSNKRRTLSRADIAKALSKSDQFDFLIDIVPREDPYAAVPPMAGMSSSAQQQQQPQSSEDGGVEMQEYQEQYQQDNVCFGRSGRSIFNVFLCL